MGLLEKLFNSHSRIKILKLFFLNPEQVFIPKEISRRAHVAPNITRRELRMFLDIGFVRQTTGMLIQDSDEVRKKAKKKKFSGYVLDRSFALFYELRELVLTVPPLSKHELATRLRRVGKVKLVVLSGIFLKSSDSRIDMLIVGDGLRKGQLDRTLRVVESEVGKELVYTILETNDFKYRLGMNDRFVRDVFDYPHEIVIDKIGVIR